MSISLKKGGRFNLSKDDGNLDKIMVGLGWDMVPGNTVDLDASVFMIDATGKLPADEFFVFFNNLKSPDNSIEHTGDNRTGKGEGDDEMILAHLSNISDAVTELVFVASIHNADVLRHHFGMLSNAYIRIVDIDTQREIIRYNLDDDNFKSVTDMEFGRLIRNGKEWNFVASGIGSKIGLQGYVDKYA
ncbi:TerD family protein [Flammeovirga kamogawensis]|uniref:TerD family protein n=1 Tax=Flammeovirga kamogawensis TaxID=373891 RepID=A0ABX8H177_9BACT|nr:TerD family protein [Flammeovirga kamogawensis]MBB6459516.1 tellurium resistance protein TerD [Flammeovirga kamogawensis]QWG09067.1 TerD family protein [Flammeovirga kamogawensis]TRX67355.1 TerD family protein [Flammeovirga kamogawensis]